MFLTSSGLTGMLSLSNMKKFYVTTPIYYVNDKPHIGTVYTTIVADVLARLHRQLGDEVMFLTGTDENSLKSIEGAKKAGMKDIQEYVTGMSSTFRETFLALGLSFDRFIRTTSNEHKKAVELFYKKVKDKGDIYKGFYEGLYCRGCEAFITESDLVDGKCPFHPNKEPEKIREENLFFRASAYRDQLLEHIDKNPSFVQPASRKNEIVNYIKDHFTDVSITRQSMEWGIPAPDESGQVLYVWFDALLNYLSGVGFGLDQDKFSKFWPADVQLVGKDIIKFHCALWPAMLLSAGLPLPRTVYAHGFYTVNGQKIGKSNNNTIDPLDLKKDYPFDTIRYFLLREIPFGEDGDFSFERLKIRYESDLANDYGNLVMRFAAMTEKYLNGIVEPISHATVKDAALKLFVDLKFSDGLELVWKRISWANKEIDSQKPWVLAKEEKTSEIRELLGKIRFTIQDATEALQCIMPETAKKVLEIVNQGKIVAVAEPIFPKKHDE